MRKGKLLLAGVVSTLLISGVALAWSADKIDREVVKAIEVFKDEVNGSEVFLAQAVGYLVFPRVYKAGFVFGAETGEGALIVAGKTIDYYRTSAGSWGLQAGAQAKSVVIAFMTEESLTKFRNSTGWKVGVDGSIALVDVGVGKAIDTKNIKDPVIGFIYGSKGLMYNLTFEGSKFSKLDKSEDAKSTDDKSTD
ncbi:MAG: lipid-binding SYLF domain-containing protein [Proteobacteria bacterium]|nr:lipid-binding SYLF domain-containing protein [Pseudomonadota bacterium]